MLICLYLQQFYFYKFKQLHQKMTDLQGMFSDFPETCKNPNYNGNNMTNRLLYEESFLNKTQKKIVYYCPAYLRIKIKNFSEMNHEDLNAQVNSVIVLTVSFNGISPLLQQKIRDLLKLSFNRDDSLKIRQTSKAITIKSHKQGVYTYTIQKSVHVAMNPNVFWSPFEIIELIMSIELKDIQISATEIESIKQEALLMIQNIELLNEECKQDKQLRDRIKNAMEEERKFLNTVGSFDIKFNLMDTTLDFMKVVYNSQGNFGVYSLAEALLHAQYTNYSAPRKIRQKQLKKATNGKVQKEDDDISQIELKKIDHSLIKPYRFAHFEIPLYKAPSVTLWTIFFPLWLLSVLTLGIFFQDSGLANRIGSLTGLQIAFVALIPVIRSQLPQSPQVTVVQILVYCEIFTGILLFIESIQVRNLTTYQFIWYQNGLFMVSAAVLVIEIFMIFILMIIHKFYWEVNYNKATVPEDLKFNRLKWQNPGCDNHFQRKIDSRAIKVATINPQMEKMKEKIQKFSQKEKEAIFKQKLKNAN